MVFYEALLFNHRFAKAFWGEQEWLCVDCHDYKTIYYDEMVDLKGSYFGCKKHGIMNP